MAAPKVNVREIDLSVRIPSFPGVYGGMVGNFARGPVDQPILVTSQNDVLKKFTPFNQMFPSYSEVYYDALNYLSRSNKLWLLRVVGEGAVMGGAVAEAESSSVVSAPFIEGYASKEALVGVPGTSGAFAGTHVDAQFGIYQSDPGAWGRSYSTKISVWRAPEYPVRVKADQGPGDVSQDVVLGAYDGNIDIVNSYVDLQSGLVFATGDSVKLSVSMGGVLPTGLSSSTIYYLRAVSGSLYSLHLTHADAVAGTNKVTITGEGDGTMTVDSVVYVDVADNTLVPRNLAEWSTGDPVTPVSAGTLPSPLITATTYYVRVVAAGLMLFDTKAHAENTSVTTGVVVLASVGDGSMVLTDLATVDVINSAIKLDQNWANGEEVKVRVKAGGTLPAPLSASETYFIVRSIDGWFKLATTRANAVLVSPITIPFTSKGEGFLVVEPIDKVETPYCFAISVYSRRQTGTLPVERFICSRDRTFKDGYGKNVFIENVLRASYYIRGAINPNAEVDSDTVVYPDTAPEMPMPTCSLASGLLEFVGGDDGLAPTEANYKTAVQKFASTSSYPLTVLMDGGYHNYAGNAEYEKAIVSLCEARMDCIGLLSTPLDAEIGTDYLNQIIDWRKDKLPSSSFGAVYTPHVVQQDYNINTEKIVAPDGLGGAAISFSAYNYELWYPPAGNKRGNITSVGDVYIRFSDAEVDTLYDAGLNPLKFDPSQGIRIWGQKTLLTTPSALDRMNVRLLLIAIEPGIKKMLEDFLFDFNTVAARSLATAKIKSFMNDVKSREGVYDFGIVCDSTNNSAEDIDNHLMNVDLYVQPTISTETINFTVVITRTGVSLAVAA